MFQKNQMFLSYQSDQFHLENQENLEIQLLLKYQSFLTIQMYLKYL
jgi:hypothetical protein